MRPPLAQSTFKIKSVKASAVVGQAMEAATASAAVVLGIAIRMADSSLAGRT
jgi:hypothetical protein